MSMYYIELLAQVREAELRGVHAVALHEDTLRSAANEGRDLFKECASGPWELIVVTPEMLGTPQFKTLLNNRTFKSRLIGVSVDEMHLISQWGEGWRRTYLNVSHLRVQVDSDVWWIGTSGSCLIIHTTLPKVKKLLGFTDDSYWLHHGYVDRPDISYEPRICQYAYTGDNMHDLDWVIEEGIKSASEIRKTLINVKTIADGSKVLRYLESLLPSNFPKRDQIIGSFHSIIDGDARNAILADFDNGEDLRILVATDCGAQGINVKGIQDVICWDIPECLDQLKQWAGRAGRGAISDSERSIWFISYGPKWIRAAAGDDGAHDDAKHFGHPDRIHEVEGKSFCALGLRAGSARNYTGINGGCYFFTCRGGRCRRCTTYKNVS